jgi:dethiobiotin synthase
MKKSGFFISGTHTGIGKTVVSSILLSALLYQKRRTCYFKPIQTGVTTPTDSDDDTWTVLKLSGCASTHIQPPVYRLKAPAAPLRAAEEENTQVSWEKLSECWKNSTEDLFWIVEGAGGLLVPITTNPSRTIRDLIIDFDLPLILVASTQLGTINHTLLSLETADRAGIQIAGYILVGEQDLGLSECISKFHPAPFLGHIPKLHQINRNTIDSLAKDWASYEFLTQ